MRKCFESDTVCTRWLFRQNRPNPGWDGVNDLLGSTYSPEYRTRDEFAQACFERQNNSFHNGIENLRHFFDGLRGSLEDSEERIDASGLAGSTQGEQLRLELRLAETRLRQVEPIRAAIVELSGEIQTLEQELLSRGLVNQSEIFQFRRPVNEAVFGAATPEQSTGNVPGSLFDQLFDLDNAVAAACQANDWDSFGAIKDQIATVQQTLEDVFARMMQARQNLFLRANQSLSEKFRTENDPDAAKRFEEAADIIFRTSVEHNRDAFGMAALRIASFSELQRGGHTLTEAQYRANETLQNMLTEQIPHLTERVGRGLDLIEQNMNLQNHDGRAHLFAQFVHRVLGENYAQEIETHYQDFLSSGVVRNLRNLNTQLDTEGLSLLRNPNPENMAQFIRLSNDFSTAQVALMDALQSTSGDVLAVYIRAREAEAVLDDPNTTATDIVIGASAEELGFVALWAAGGFIDASGWLARQLLTEYLDDEQMADTIVTYGPDVVVGGVLGNIAGRIVRAVGVKIPLAGLTGGVIGALLAGAAEAFAASPAGAGEDEWLAQHRRPDGAIDPNYVRPEETPEE